MVGWTDCRGSGGGGGGGGCGGVWIDGIRYVGGRGRSTERALGGIFGNDGYDDDGPVTEPDAVQKLSIPRRRCYFSLDDGTEHYLPSIWKAVVHAE